MFTTVQIDYRRVTMEKPYARVGENGVSYTGPPTSTENSTNLTIGVFGPNAEDRHTLSRHLRLVGLAEPGLKALLP